MMLGTASAFGLRDDFLSQPPLPTIAPEVIGGFPAKKVSKKIQRGTEM
jgi:hypothetical protein